MKCPDGGPSNLPVNQKKCPTMVALSCNGWGRGRRAYKRLRRPSAVSVDGTELNAAPKRGEFIQSWRKSSASPLSLRRKGSKAGWWCQPAGLYTRVLDKGERGTSAYFRSRIAEPGPNEEIHFRYDVTKGPVRIVSATSAASQVHSSNENSRPPRPRRFAKRPRFEHAHVKGNPVGPPLFAFTRHPHHEFV